MKIKLSSNYAIETDLCSVDLLQAHKDELDLSIVETDGEIQEAIAYHLQTGEYADPHWFARAKLAIKLKRLAQQKLMRELARRRRLERQENHVAERPLSHYFVEVCKERMEPKLYDLLVEAAIQRKQASGAWVDGEVLKVKSG